MENKIKYEDAIPRVMAINRKLFDAGLNLRQVAKFWKDCINEAKTREVMALFYEGFTDAEIAEKTGYGVIWISQISTKGLVEGVTKKMVRSDV